MKREPANPDAHAFLTANGYIHTYHCTFEDDGDPENGPHLTGGEWDEYTSAEDRVYINYYDGDMTFEMRDLRAEEAEKAYFSQMGKDLNTEQEAALERLIDDCGLCAVLQSISSICDEKSEHILQSYNDPALAKAWATACGIVGVASNDVIITGIGEP